MHCNYGTKTNIPPERSGSDLSMRIILEQTCPLWRHEPRCRNTCLFCTTLALSIKHTWENLFSDCSGRFAQNDLIIAYTIWAPPHERVHNGLVPAPRPLTVLIPGSHSVPPLVPTRRKVLSPKLSPGPAGSRRPLTGHQHVHRSLNAPPCALTVFHRLHEIYHTVAHGRLSRCHVPCYISLPCTTVW